MPWLPIYANEEDMKWVFKILSEDTELAFLVSTGEKRWAAVESLEYREDTKLGLWHIPSGPLPLLRLGKTNGVIVDPFKGWNEERTGADPTTPYFGAGHHGVFWLNARCNGNFTRGIGLTSFEWIGNRYETCHPTTDKCWKRLGRRIRKEGRKIPREGPIDEIGAEIWALPGSLNDIESGVPRDPNP